MTLTMNNMIDNILYHTQGLEFKATEKYLRYLRQKLKLTHEVQYKEQISLIKMMRKSNNY